MRDSAVQVGVVSDTHGLFDRKLNDLFRGSAFILHAAKAQPSASSPQ